MSDLLKTIDWDAADYKDALRTLVKHAMEKRANPVGDPGDLATRGMETVSNAWNKIPASVQPHVGHGLLGAGLGAGAGLLRTMTRKKGRPLQDMLGGALLGGAAGGLGSLGAHYFGQASQNTVKPAITDPTTPAARIGAARTSLGEVNPNLDQNKFNELLTAAQNREPVKDTIESLKADQVANASRWDKSKNFLGNLGRHADDIAKDVGNNPVSTLGAGLASGTALGVGNSLWAKRRAFDELQKTPSVYGVEKDLKHQATTLPKLDRSSLVSAARKASPQLGQVVKSPAARKLGMLGTFLAPLLYRQFGPAGAGGGGYARTSEVDAAARAAREAGNKQP